MDKPLPDGARACFSRRRQILCDFARVARRRPRAPRDAVRASGAQAASPSDGRWLVVLVLAA